MSKRAGVVTTHPVDLLRRRWKSIGTRCNMVHATALIVFAASVGRLNALVASVGGHAAHGAARDARYLVGLRLQNHVAK